MNEYYIVNLSHQHRDDRYVTLWRPDDRGYAFPLSWAGRYPEERVRASLDYYNSGWNLAVPCAVLETLGVAPAAGDIDGDAGPVVPNNAATWKRILRHVIAQPSTPYVPVYKRARGREDMSYAAKH